MSQDDWVAPDPPAEDGLPPAEEEQSPEPPQRSRLSRLRWQLIMLGVGLLLIAAAGLFFVLEIFSQPDDAPPEIALADAQIYTEAAVGEPRFVNPLLAVSQTDRDLASLVFSGLTRLDEFGQPVPDIAESWSVSSDGLTYTFRLRDDVTWHDGAPLTAEDVAFTFSLLRDPDFPGAPSLARFWQTVETYADDTFTVRFVLTQPLAAFPEYAGVGILPQHWLAGVPVADIPTDPFNLDPIGSGRMDWITVEDDEGAVRVTLAPYEDYYDTDRRVELDQVVMTFYPEASEAFAALGPEALGMGGLPNSQLEAVFNSPRINVYASRLPAYGAVIFNQQSEELPFFQEEEVRTALTLAVDRRALAGQGQGALALTNSPILPGTWAYNPTLPSLPYTPDVAEQQLNEAGWTLSGDIRQQEDVEIAFTLLTLDSPLHESLAEAVAEDWAAIGVEAEVIALEPAALLSRLQGRSFEAALVEFSQGGIADPDPYPFWHESQIENGQNYSGFVDRDISEALEIARRDPNGVRRAELYREFQREFLEAGAAVPLYNPVYHYAVSCQVVGVQNLILADPSDRFRMLHEWRIATPDEIDQVCP